MFYFILLSKRIVLYAFIYLDNVLASSTRNTEVRKMSKMSKKKNE